MKNTILFLFLFTAILQSKAQNTENEIFNGIQDKIYNAFLTSSEKQDSTSLIQLESTLQEFTPKTFLTQ